MHALRYSFGNAYFPRFTFFFHRPLILQNNFMHLMPTVKSIYFCLNIDFTYNFVPYKLMKLSLYCLVSFPQVSGTYLATCVENKIAQCLQLPLVTCARSDPPRNLTLFHHIRRQLRLALEQFDEF